MNLKSLIVLLLIIAPVKIFSQETYILNLKPEEWKYTAGPFYISEIYDERNEKSDAGQVLSGNKSVKAKFKSSLENDIRPLITTAMLPDQNKTPLLLVVKKFVLSETGTLAKHKAILDFSLVFYREINGKRYQLYEANGRPEFTINGAYPDVHEKNIIQSVRTVIESFNKWISENADVPLMARRVVVVFDEYIQDTSAVKDTIIWNKNYKLRWSDFRGIPKSTGYMAESNCIFIYSALPIVKNGIMELHVKVAACFDRNTSWVKKDQMKPELLDHEQLHFDICESHIRLFKESLRAVILDPMEYDKTVERIFDDTWERYQKEQQLYDNETEHGIKTEAQARWTKNVKEALNNRD